MLHPVKYIREIHVELLLKHQSKLFRSQFSEIFVGKTDI